MKKEVKSSTAITAKLTARSGKLSWYIKSKGRPGRYFVYKEGELGDAIVNYYNDKYIKGKTRGNLVQYKKEYESRITGEKTTSDPYLKASVTKQIKDLINKRPKIIESIRTGKSRAIIKKLLSSTRSIIERKKKDMLRPLVLDESLLNIITRDTNLKKIKSRLNYIAKIKNKKGETVAEIKSFNKTPDEVSEELKKAIKIGEEIGSQRFKQITKELKWAYIEKQQGSMHQIVGEVELTMTFTRGRGKSRWQRNE